MRPHDRDVELLDEPDRAEEELGGVVRVIELGDGEHRPVETGPPTKIGSSSPAIAASSGTASPTESPSAGSGRAHRALLAVLGHEHDRPVEVRIGEDRCGDQQLPAQRSSLIAEASALERGGASCRPPLLLRRRFREGSEATLQGFARVGIRESGSLPMRRLTQCERVHDRAAVDRVEQVVRHARGDELADVAVRERRPRAAFLIMSTSSCRRRRTGPRRRASTRPSSACCTWGCSGRSSSSCSTPGCSARRAAR